MRSSSKDGRLIAAVLERLGLLSVAGSSSRGGAAGLRKLVKLARAGSDTSVTVDGPRGPRYRVKEGILQLAALSGAPIIPTAVSPSGVKYLGSWDRTMLPMPFARIRVRYGAALSIPRKAGREDLDRYRLELEQNMHDLCDRLDGENGLTPVPPAEPEAGDE